ncbi:MAG: ABC transporter substrate-binding protein [Candidatus Dormiibacterota bacterium]
MLGRGFGLDLLAAVTGEPVDSLWPALHQLQRLDLVREERRWPRPEFRFKHALIQEAVYGSLVGTERAELHRRAGEWLQADHTDNLSPYFGLLALHWKQARRPDRAIAFLRLAGDRALEQWALDEAIGHYRDLVSLLRMEGRGAEAADALFSLALALHTAMRYEQANAAWQEAFGGWQPPPPAARSRSTLRIAKPWLPGPPDPIGTNAWTNIQLSMQVYDRLVEARPGRTVVPSLADRWEVSADGLRYEFRLREDLVWHDGTPLTAHDIEASVKHGLDPVHPAASATIYFVLTGATDYHFGSAADSSGVGIRALDARRLEITLSNPAPYFMSVLNRPDANAHRLPESAVGTGAFELMEASTDRLVLTRRWAAGWRRGNADTVEMVRLGAEEAAAAYRRGELDMVLLRIDGATPELPADHPEAQASALTTSLFLVPNCLGRPASVALRRALAGAVDRERVAGVLAPPGAVATGGVVPPALQGHTPDIAHPFDPAESRRLLDQAGRRGELHLGCPAAWTEVGEAVAAGWREHLGVEVEVTIRAPSEGLMAEEVDVEVANWLPGYPDPEYYLRLLLHSQSLSNRGGWSCAAFDELVERAVAQREIGARLALFHDADRLAIQDQCALIPVAYLGALAFVKPWVRGWWEWGKSSASFADLEIAPTSPRYSVD